MISKPKINFKTEVYRPACVLAGVPGLAACEGEGEEVPLARDLHPVRQLVIQGGAVPAHNKEYY